MKIKIKNKNPFFSIIIPCYNVENEITRMINSIFNQSFCDYEIICVDDCSTDKTLNVLKAYDDIRIRIIHNEINLGAAESRNIGLKYAKGKYVWFVDGDDLVANDSVLEDIYNGLKKHMVDMFFVSMGFIGSNRVLTYNPSASIDELMKDIWPGPAHKIIRRKFIIDEKCRFVTSHTANDVLFHYQCMTKMKSWYVSNIIAYMYSGSHISNADNTVRYINEICNIFTNVYDMINDYNGSKEYIMRVLEGKRKYAQSSHLYNQHVNKVIDSAIKYVNSGQYDLIVSLTSYPDRFNDDCIFDCLNSLISQKTDCVYKIVFSLFKDDIKKVNKKLLNFLDENNIEILLCDKDIKSHKKYYYVMKKYDYCPIITVDDDCIYSSHLVESLFNTHLKYEDSAVGGYIYKLNCGLNGKLINGKIDYGYRLTTESSSYTYAFGSGGGTLFPVKFIKFVNSNSEYIEKLIYKYIYQDEILLKKLLNDCNIPVANSVNTHVEKRNMREGLPKSSEFILDITKKARSNSLWDTENKSVFEDIIYELLSPYNYNTFNVIVTMTSWVKRINIIDHTIKSILNQTYKPNRIYINLSVCEFPNKEKDIPSNVLKVINSDESIVINWVEGENTKTMKKVFPILKYINDDDIIIDIDDDIIVDETFIESRINDFLKYDKKYSITSNVKTYSDYDKSSPLGNMYVVSACSLFTKKMLNNWEKYVNDLVIHTYSDDSTYAVILWLNGYKNMPASDFLINGKSDHAIDLSLSDGNEHSISKNHGTVCGIRYFRLVDDWIKELTGVALENAFGKFSSNNNTVNQSNKKNTNDNIIKPGKKKDDFVTNIYSFGSRINFGSTRIRKK